MIVFVCQTSFYKKPSHFFRIGLSPSSPSEAAFSAGVAEPKFRLSDSASLNSKILELDESGVLTPEAIAGAFGGVAWADVAKGGLSGGFIIGGGTITPDGRL